MIPFSSLLTVTLKLPTIWQVSISASGSWCTKIMNQSLPLSMIQRYDNWACLPEKLLMLQGVTVSRSRRVNWCRRRSPAIFSAGCFFRLDTFEHFLRELLFRVLCDFYVEHSCKTFGDCGFSLITLTVESAVAIRKSVGATLMQSRTWEQLLDGMPWNIV